MSVSWKIIKIYQNLTYICLYCNIFSLSLSLFVSISLSPSLSLCFSLSLSLSFSLSLCLYFSLSVYLSVCLSLFLSVSGKSTVIELNTLWQVLQSNVKKKQKRCHTDFTKPLSIPDLKLCNLPLTGSTVYWLSCRCYPSPYHIQIIVSSQICKLLPQREKGWSAKS